MLVAGGNHILHGDGVHRTPLAISRKNSDFFLKIKKPHYGKRSQKKKKAQEMFDISVLSRAKIASKVCEWMIMNGKKTVLSATHGFNVGKKERQK